VSSNFEPTEEEVQRYEAAVEERIAQLEKRMSITPALKLQAAAVWEMLVQGYEKPQILEELEVTEAEYSYIVRMMLRKEKPSQADIERERALAHDRYLYIYRKLHDKYEEADKTQDLVAIAQQLRATTKEIGDMYSVKMPEKLEIDVNVSETQVANAKLKTILQAVSKSKEIEAEPIEAEVVEDES
jgi:hypothetical protein